MPFFRRVDSRGEGRTRLVRSDVVAGVFASGLAKAPRLFCRHAGVVAGVFAGAFAPLRRLLAALGCLSASLGCA